MRPSVDSSSAGCAKSSRPRGELADHAKTAESSALQAVAGPGAPPAEARLYRVDNHNRFAHNTRAHERRDPENCEDDERGQPARDPVPELGARPRGRAPEKPLP